MSQKIRNAIAAIVLLLLFSGLVFGIWKFAKLIATLHEPLIVAIVAASATIITSTFAVVVGRYLERKKDAESHFRKPKQEQFDEFLKIIFSVTGEAASVDEAALPNQLNEWQRKLVLFAGPGTISAYIQWKRQLVMAPTSAKTFLLLASLMKAIRADLGISNFGLNDGDFAHLIIRHADLFTSMVAKNPNVTFQEIAEMEKLLGLEPSEDKAPS